MKILVAKMSLHQERSKQEASGFLWLDRLCNGLLSHAQYRGFWGRSEKSSSGLVWLRPTYSAFDVVFIGTEKKSFPWQILESIFGPTLKKEIFWKGDFTEKEIEQGEKILSMKKLRPWIEAQQGEAAY